MRMTEEHTAPIILFVYNRPEHTRRTVESLAKNSLAQESTLYIFSDAAKNDADIDKVNEVRDYIASLGDLNYFNAVIIEEAEKNKGLADSIINGVTKVMQKHGRAIILEDDLLSAPDFLDFMNQSLVFYEKDSSIGSISGYSPLETLPREYREDIWVASRTSSLGWATWNNRWEEVKWKISDFETFKKDKKARKRFDECGSDRYDRLRRQIEVGANSWSIRFGYWQSRAGRYTVFPATTRIQHIGWDGSGVHGTYAGPLDTHIKPYAIDFKLKTIKPNQQIITMLKSAYSGSLPGQFSRYLRNNGFEKLELTLRTILSKTGCKMTKTKSILFHYSLFDTGGAEKSILRLTKLLSDKGWDVTLVFSTGGGSLEAQIDPRVKVYHLRSASAGSKFKVAKGLHKLKFIGDLLLYTFFWLEGLFKSFTFLFRHYDAAAISLHGLSPKFVCRFVRADKKLQWIRNDLNVCDVDGKAARSINKYHACIDQYICVSQTALDSLRRLFPETCTKSLVIPNVIEAEQMLAGAELQADPLSEYGSVLKVITVCRLSDKAKGLLRMVRVHKRLSDEEIDFVWLVVGDGADRERMQRAIDDAGLSDKMILLGSKENPFPYFKAADISATLSYYEGLCGAVNEAKVIGKPVLATQFSGINEQIVHEESGLIVANDENAIYEGLKRLLTDDVLREKLINNALSKKIMDDDYKIEMIDKLIEMKNNSKSKEEVV